MTPEQLAGLTQPHVVTPEIQAKVKAMSAFGITQAQMCAYLGFSEDTLQKYYRKELDSSKVDAVMQAANRLFRKGVEEGDTTSLIFYLKTQGRWKEPKEEDQKDTLVELLIKQLQSKNDEK